MNKRSPLYPASILLPDFDKTNGEKWAVIACDQFTSEKEYWHEVEKTVGSAPSTLSLIIPEVFLEETDKRIPLIDKKAKEYEQSVLQKHENAMIYLERVQSDGRVRRGIVAMVDLEDYDFSASSTSLIRATEGTVLSRIPPRVKVRKLASIETPHVMLLIDDPSKTVIESFAKKKNLMQKAYGFDLMLGGGRVDGYFIDKDDYVALDSALTDLVSEKATLSSYGKNVAPVLFAVGDGNHSLATAKTIYEELKKEIGDSALTHPARYALCEIVNVHDDALSFEPIYRVVFGANENHLISALSNYEKTLSGVEKAQKTTIITKNGETEFTFNNPEKQLTVGTLQQFLDDYVASNKGIEVDYVHGEDSVKEIVRKTGAIGFIFTGMEKSQLFKTVAIDGALPRKTFSMGHARDKRYYLECRKIKPL
ncbi:MAG: DUF1015 domain-containing protein [Clostridia bacterium]|nr:DUF1015 domain-containing protein [Clostridia bacterium]